MTGEFRQSPTRSKSHTIKRTLVAVFLFSMCWWVYIMLQLPCLAALLVSSISIPLLFATKHEHFLDVDAELFNANVESLDPLSFERWTGSMLAYLGWDQLDHIGGSGDRGVDLRGIYKGERWVVQCKYYRQNVTPREVRELIGTMHIQQANRAALITTRGFSEQCRAEAKAFPVVLWSTEDIRQMVQSHRSQQHEPTRRENQRRRRRNIVLLSAFGLVNLLALAAAIVGLII